MIAAIIEPLVQYGFMRQGLIVAICVGLTCGVLSCLLVVRHEALLGDAISHAVLLGVVVGFLAAGTAGLLIGALAAAMLTAVAITYVERNTPVKLDAAMGICFTATFALGIAIMSIARPRGIDLFHVLLGNVLGVTWDDVLLSVLTSVAVLALVVVLFRWLHVWSLDKVLATTLGVPIRALDYIFTTLLSATIVISMRAVGLVLVVAMLIIPGATALLLTTRLQMMMIVAGALGTLASVVGLFGSYYVDVASGPAIVLTSAAMFVIAMVGAPQSGVLARRRARRTSSTYAPSRRARDAATHVG